MSLLPWPTTRAPLAIQTATDGLRQTQRHESSLRRTSRDRSRSHAPRADLQRNVKPAIGAEAAILQERARIARELHDSVSQTLYAITLTASRARKLLNQDEPNAIQAVIEDVLQLANDGQSELRALLTDIHSDRRTSSGGLTAGLAQLAADVGSRHSLAIRVSLADEPDLPVTQNEALIGISREALHNIVKHAGAARVDLVLEVLPGEVLLVIIDDGRGFDPAASRPGHFGLQSMRERAATVGGTLELTSSDGLGTHIRVRIPRASRA